MAGYLYATFYKFLAGRKEHLIRFVHASGERNCEQITLTVSNDQLSYAFSVDVNRLDLIKMLQSFDDDIREAINSGLFCTSHTVKLNEETNECPICILTGKSR